MMTKQLDKEILGTEEMPYDPDDPKHKAIIDAYEVIKAASEEIEKEMPEQTKPMTIYKLLLTDDPKHKAINDAYEVIKAASEEIEKDDKKPTLNVILDAIRELTKTVGELAKKQDEMKERHDKWIKAGKF